MMTMPHTTTATASVATAPPPPPDADRLRQLQWQSRRGLLELDLLLSRFWQQHAHTLTPAEWALLTDWLAMDDPDLWLLLTCPPAADATAAALAQKINTFHPHTTKR